MTFGEHSFRSQGLYLIIIPTRCRHTVYRPSLSLSPVGWRERPTNGTLSLSGSLTTMFNQPPQPPPPPIAFTYGSGRTLLCHNSNLSITDQGSHVHFGRATTKAGVKGARVPGDRLRQGAERR